MEKSGVVDDDGRYYKIKLAMLFLLRATEAHKREEIDYFRLAANMPSAHPFDDLAFGYTRGQSAKLTLLRVINAEDEALTWKRLMSNKDKFRVKMYLNGRLKMKESIMNGPWEECDMVLFTTARIDNKGSMVHSQMNEIARIQGTCVTQIKLNSDIYKMLKTPEDMMNLVNELLACAKTQEFNPEVPIFQKYMKHLQNSVLGFKADKPLKNQRLFCVRFLQGYTSEEIQGLREVLFANAKTDQENFHQTKSRLGRVLVNVIKGNPAEKKDEIKVELKTDLTETEVGDFLEDFFIASAQPGEQDLEQLIKDEIEFVFDDIDASDSSMIFNEVYLKAQKWWMDDTDFLTETDDWFWQSRSKLLSKECNNAIESAKSEYRSTKLFYENLDELAPYMSSSVVNVISCEITHVLNSIKICQILEKSESKYIIMKHACLMEMVDDIVAAFKGKYDTLVIVGDGPIIEGFFQILKSNQKKKIIWIGQVAEYYGLPTVTIELNVGLNDLTQESRNAILNDARIVLQGRTVRLKDLYKPKLEYLITGKLLAQIANEEIPEIGRAPLVDKQTNSIPRKLRRIEYSNDLKRQNIVHYKPEEIRSTKSDKFILVSAEAGMGKTHLLSTIKGNSFKWRYRINLAETYSMLRRGGSVIPLYFLRDACNMDFDEYDLFKRYYESFGEIVLFIDAFDEIAPDYKDLVMDLFRSLAKSKVNQIWLTTRPYYKDELEFALDTTAYTLEPLSVEDQKSYLKQQLKKCKNAEIEEFLKRLLYPECLTQVPQLLMMAVELYDELLAEDKINLIMLYDKLYDKSVKKKVSPDAKMTTDKKQVLDKRARREIERLAMFSLFELDDLSKVFTPNEIEHIQIVIKHYRDGKSEFIKSIVAGRPLFIHRSFAEYFAATWLACSCDTNENIKLFLMSVGFFDKMWADVRKFFDMALANETCMAAITNDIVAVEETPKTSIDSKDLCNRTALHLASAYNHLQTAGALLRLGATISPVDDIFGWTPINYAKACHHWLAVAVLGISGAIGSDDMYFLSYQNSCKLRLFKVEVKEEWTELHLAALRDDAEQTKRMLKKKAHHVNVKNKNDITPLHMAVSYGSDAVVKALLNNYANVNAGNVYKLTPLHLAISFDRYDMANYLIDKGAKMGAKDEAGQTPLHLAIEKGHYDLTCLLIDRGSDVDATSKDGSTPLHFAAAYGHMNIAKYLVKRGAKNVKDNKGMTALHQAAKHGHRWMAAYLIRNGYEVDAVDESGSIPLHYASAVYETSMVTLLVKAGADVNFKNSHGETSLHVATECNNLRIVKYLIANGGDIHSKTNKKHTSLHKAICLKHNELAIELINMRSDVDAKDANNMTPLHTAVRVGNLKMTKVLLDQKCNPNAKGKDDMTSLHIAILQGLDEIASELINNGADLNAKEVCGFTPLHLASQAGDLALVKCLIEKGADIHAVSNENKMAFSMAMNKKHGEVARLLLEKGGKEAVIKPPEDPKPEKKTQQEEQPQVEVDKTPLHTAIKKKNIFAFRYLLKKGCDPNGRDSLGQTPLHVAVDNGQEEIAFELVEGGCNIDLQDNDGFNALHLAAKNQRFIRYLVDSGCHLEARAKNSLTPFLLAVLVGDEDIVKEFIKRGANLHARTQSKFTALHLAAQEGHTKLVSYLIVKGCDPNSKSDDEQTPLHVAAISNHFKVVEELIRNGADVTETASEQITPLHTAAMKNKPRMIKYLIEKGADPNARTINGHTPLHVAVIHRGFEGLKKLIELGSSVHAKTNCCNTPLHFAIETRNIRFIKYLITQGSDLKAKTDIAQTPFHLSVVHGWEEAVRMLAEKGSDIHEAALEGITAVHIAAVQGNVGIVKYLIELGCDLNARTINGDTPLHLAVMNKHNDVALELIASGADIHSLTNEGLLALHMAAQVNNLTMIKYFVAQGCDVEQRTTNKETAFHLSVANGHTDGAEELMRSGCDIHARARDDYTALHVAAVQGRVAMVRFLVGWGGDLNAKTNEDKTPLQLAVAYGHDDISKELIDKGCSVDENMNKDALANASPLQLAIDDERFDDVIKIIERGCDLNITNKEGLTPLHQMILKDQDEIAHQLIAKGSDINAKDPDGFTPLHTALEMRKFDIAMKLISSGSDLNAKTKLNLTALHFAILAGNDQLAIAIIDLGADVNAPGKDNYTALHIAIQHDKLALIKRLIDRGANLEARTKDNLTPLHVASLLGSAASARVLAERGSDVNARARRQETALHMASSKGFTDVVRYLLTKGANPNLQEEQGLTPLHIAVANDRNDAAVMLIDAGADLTCHCLRGETPLRMAFNKNNMFLSTVMMAKWGKNRAE